MLIDSEGDRNSSSASHKAGMVSPVSQHDERLFRFLKSSFHLSPENWQTQSRESACPSTSSCTPDASFSGHAAPLMPIRGRDVEAMMELFDTNDIYEIETDIRLNLLKMYPEPCWEEEPYEFLSEFL